jgi:hypothetical protein
MVKKLLVFDFDQTLTKYSLFDQYKLIAIDNVSKILSFLTNSGQIIKKSVPFSFFNDYEELYKLFFELKKMGYALSIASFNYSNYITQFVDVVFPDIFDHIIGIDNVMRYVRKYLPNTTVKLSSHKILDKNCPEGYGKNIMLQILSKIYKLDYSKIYFFDDNNNNIVCAKKVLNVNVYNNKKTGVTKKIIENFILKK